MLSKKIKTIISTIVISLSIITATGNYREVKASSYPMTIEQAEFDKYKVMTLEELQKVAKPMPKSNLDTGKDEFGEYARIKFISPLYNDKNIYYVKNNAFGKEYLEFYKFIYVKPWLDDVDAVEYHAVRWELVNNKLERVADIKSTEGNKEFHDKLVAQFLTTAYGIEVNPSDEDLYHALRIDFLNEQRAYKNVDEYKELYNKAINGMYKPTIPIDVYIASNTNNSNDNSGSDNHAIKKYTKKRIFGLTRIDTSKAIAEEFQSEKIDNVIITSGLNFPDALSGSVLAKKLDAPILLVGTTPIESANAINYVKDHLTKDGTIYILGGQGAVNERFIASFKSLGFNNIQRLWGTGRYDTNKAINNKIDAEEGTPVIIASGEGFADALSISSIASVKGYPIVLTSKNNLAQQAKDTLKEINPKQVYIIGGTGSISDSVKAQIKSVTNLTDENIIRIWGNDRYKTSLNIAKHFNLDGETVTFASGKNFPDALAGSILSAELNAPLVLVGDEASEQKKYIDETKYIKQIFFGGEGSISKKVEEFLSK